MSGRSEAPNRAAIAKRYKDVQFMSISPLDRLLNQRALDDEIKVQVSCKSRNGASRDTKDYDLTMNRDDINKQKCHDGTTPNKGENCQKD